MSWIRTIPPEEAQGELARLYREAVRRAGRVYHIVRSMSLSPGVLEASMAFYVQVMLARSGLTRAQREMLAVVVSRANGCHY
jgi:alkylhydroperoxidase family enzyme